MAPPAFTGFVATTTPSDCRHSIPNGYSFPYETWGTTPAMTALSGSSTVLSVRAARFHPGGLGDCTCLCLRLPCWLRPFWEDGHPQISNGAEIGSRLRIAARTVRLPGLRLCDYPHKRPEGYMFTGIYMVEPFIRQGPSGLS